MTEKPNHIANRLAEASMIEIACRRAFDQACETINRTYPSGALAWIASNRPELDKQLSEVEDKINTLWLLAIEGKATAEEFREAIRAWYRLNLTVIEAFKERAII